jgi:hypothetical protein
MCSVVVYRKGLETATRLHPGTRRRMMELYLRSPLRFHGLVPRGLILCTWERDWHGTNCNDCVFRGVTHVIFCPEEGIGTFVLSGRIHLAPSPLPSPEDGGNILLRNLEKHVVDDGRLCGLVTRIPGYGPRGPGFDSRRCQFSEQ